MIKYRKVKVLGKGSYGQAVLVESKEQANKRFVVKEVQIAHLSYKERVAAQSEAKVLSQMSHSNICGYVESFVEGSKLYIVMDFADGGDLSGAIERRKKEGNPFTEDEVMNIFVQLLLALRHVHERKILHRDLKSQNIFLTKNGVVKLGDFGIAKVLETTSDCARTQIGTPYYLSPEICEDRPYGKKSDVWSLGCVLYELCLLSVPFQAQNMPALVRKIIYSDPPPINSRYSRDLQILAASLLKKNPDDRPSITQILRSPYVQRHIAELLSHTIQKGTGGVERLARPQQDRAPSRANEIVAKQRDSVSSNASAPNADGQNAQRKPVEGYQDAKVLKNQPARDGQINLPQPRFDYKYKQQAPAMPEPRPDPRPGQPYGQYPKADIERPGFERERQNQDIQRKQQVDQYHQYRADSQNHQYDMNRAGIAKDNRSNNVDNMRQELARKEYLRNQEMARKNRERIVDQQKNPQIQIFGGQDAGPSEPYGRQNQPGAMQARGPAQQYDAEAFNNQFFANREAARMYKARVEAEIRGADPYGRRASSRGSSRESSHAGEGRVEEIRKAGLLEKEAERLKHEQELAEAYRRQREDRRRLQEKLQDRNCDAGSPKDYRAAYEPTDARQPNRANSLESVDNDRPSVPVKSQEELLAEAYRLQREEQRALRKKIEERKRNEMAGVDQQMEDHSNDVTLPMKRGENRSWNDSPSPMPVEIDRSRDVAPSKSKEEELAAAYKLQREERRALRQKIEERKRNELTAAEQQDADISNDATVKRDIKKSWSDPDLGSGSDSQSEGRVIVDDDENTAVRIKAEKEKARMEDMKRREKELQIARQQALLDKKALKSNTEVPVSMVIGLEPLAKNDEPQRNSNSREKDDSRGSSRQQQDVSQNQGGPGASPGKRRRRRWGDPVNPSDIAVIEAQPVPVPAIISSAAQDSAEEADEPAQAVQQTVDDSGKKVSKQKTRDQARECFRMLRARRECIEKKIEEKQTEKPRSGKGRRPHPYRDSQKDKAKNLEEMLGKLAQMQNAVRYSLDACKQSETVDTSLELLDPHDLVRGKLEVFASERKDERSQKELDVKGQGISEDDDLYKLSQSLGEPDENFYKLTVTLVEQAENELNKFISGDQQEVVAEYEDGDVADMRCDLARALCIDDQEEDEDDLAYNVDSSKASATVLETMVEISKTFIEP